VSGLLLLTDDKAAGAHFTCFTGAKVHILTK
jgi:hypothetical protein